MKIRKWIAYLRAWWQGKNRVFTSTPTTLGHQRFQSTVRASQLAKRNTVINHPEVKLRNYIQLTIKDEIIVFDELIREYFLSHWILSQPSKIQK